MSALAATAGIAIENARLYEESRQWQEWLRASAEISRRLLSATTPMRTRCDGSPSASGAWPPPTWSRSSSRSAARPTSLKSWPPSGSGEDELEGVRYPIADSVAWRAMERRAAV